MNLGFLSGKKWKPHQNLVYKSWYKGGSHFGKSATVTIILENKEYYGTFSVRDQQCEIWLGHGEWKYGLECGQVELSNIQKLVLPLEAVSITKSIQQKNTIATQGQNGYAGKEIIYKVEILKPLSTII